MTTWTPDRPTKPGKYWLSIHPDKRPGEQRPDAIFPAVMACEVTQVVDWMLGEENANALDHEQRSRVWAVKYLSGGAWLRLAAAWFDGALWRPYVEPADPHAQPVPQQSARLTLNITTEERQTLSGALHAMAGSLRKLAKTKPSEAHRAIPEADKMDALNARICEVTR